MKSKTAPSFFAISVLERIATNVLVHLWKWCPTHPSGYIQITIARLWPLFLKECAQYSLGNLTINDIVCQYITKLDRKPIRDR